MSLFAGFEREYSYISSIARTFYRMRHVKPDSERIITTIVAEQAAKTPNAIAIVCPHRTYTYRELNEGANRHAHWAKAQGIRKGDVVALLMENRADYLMAWMGVVKLGGIMSLINTNLRGTPLAHSINISDVKHVIVGQELAANYMEVADLVTNKPRVWSSGGPAAGAEDLDEIISTLPGTPPVIDDKVTCKDRVFYIFTSGTTGLPKAANISHTRMLFMMYGFAGALNAKASDRMYNCLPMYHSVGGMCALGPALLTGGSVVIKRKFSVSEFWDDIHKYEATLFQYIGELCRYLLNAPPSAHERDHKIRAITGNGLRPEIWPAFQKRFAIPKIVEFYGATEGNVSMINYDGHVGSIGRIPNYMKNIIICRVIKFDVETEMPVRGPDGHCIECADGEAGEAIGKIVDEPGRTFEGYTQEKDTQKKILTDVFEKGDRWFRTGDLLRKDEHGYFYFVDRIGDTFRWKGENVATSEVSEVLSVIPGIKEANVYGVQVPGMDGRAGMASLIVGPEFDLDSLGERLKPNLAAYARPIFLRLQQEMEITGTFKQRKVDLVKEGFNPETISDPLYVLDPITCRYEKLDKDGYETIMSGRVKL
ncbi:MAG TPA: long-chain-acyl-CoA synthetase [Rhizomicrobium sp.]|nr:long-chain-acyl-CoA synthetase [Rhizomicrobium sp.]